MLEELRDQILGLRVGPPGSELAEVPEPFEAVRIERVVADGTRLVVGRQGARHRRGADPSEDVLEAVPLQVVVIDRAGRRVARGRRLPPRRRGAAPAATTGTAAARRATR